jgi:nucleoside-diphosphate-sugar epimerase
MLNHRNSGPVKPSRVVILGASGFVGGATKQAFEVEKTEVLSLGRAKINLLDKKASLNIVNFLRPTDTLVVISAEAPCKDAESLIRNIRMMVSICTAIEIQQPQHVIYISSDAVYADSKGALKESSNAEPGSIHGAMHLTREIMLKDAVKGPLAILRPTLIYGIDDPHNGYGPNRFRRLAAAGKEIILFGKGEEKRDHVLIDDVAELIRLMSWYKSHGVLNAATGTLTSFRNIAVLAVKLSGKAIKIKSSPRVGEIPHNGYRPFDPAATKSKFPNFNYTPLEVGMAIKSR